VPGLRVADTIKEAGDDQLTTRTLPREHLYLVQTPQAFRRDLLSKAYANSSRSSGSVTDDSQLVEALGQRCAIVEGSALNIKITTQIDLKLAAAILPLLESPKRPGATHPYSDEQQMWSALPKLKASDLFGA
jgi:2-C-methyl-D-erythritol 4-phosphate cytidylyltransferase